MAGLPGGSAPGGVPTFWTSHTVLGTPGAVYGVNLSGPEFATLISWPSAADWTDLAAKGIKLVRLPIAWENLQTTLGGSLNATYLANLQSALVSAANAGIGVIVELHNFAHYAAAAQWGTTVFYAGNGGNAGTGVSAFGDATLTTTQFADVWTKLAQPTPTGIGGSSALVGYGLMNEPANQVNNPNLITYPNWFSLNWFTFNAGAISQLSPNTNPIGSYGPAWSLTSGGTGFSGVGQAITLTNAVQYTFSIYIKSGGSESVQLALGATNASFTATPTWQRVSVTATGTGASVNAQFLINIGASGHVIQFANAQVEVGAAPTTYIGNPFLAFAQAGISAIRALDTTTPIYVCGYFYGTAYSWPQQNWDLAALVGGNLIFDAHQYFDGPLGGGPGQYTGTYASYGITSATGVAELAPFVNWLAAVQLPGFMGEFNVPSNASSTSSSISGSVLTVGGTVTNTFDVGLQISGPGITAGPNSVIASLGTGTGGAGTYNLIGSPGNVASVAIKGVITPSSPWYVLQGNFETALRTANLGGALWSYRNNGTGTTDPLNIAPQSGVDDARLAQLFASTVTGVGTSTGVGTASAVGAALNINPAAGTAGGIGTASAAGTALKPAIGTAGGVGSAAALVRDNSCDLLLEDGTGNVILEDFTGFLALETCDAVGTATGIGSASGVGAAVVTGGSVGSAGGIGSANAVGIALKPATGTATGIGTTSAVGNALKPSSGTETGIGSASAVGTGINASVGTATGIGRANAVGTTPTTGSGDGLSGGIGSASAVGVAIGGVVVQPPGGAGFVHRFTRKRWRELQMLIAAEAAARVKAERLTTVAKQEPLLVAADAAAAAIQAALIEGENARLDRELVRNANTIRAAIRAATQVKLMRETAAAVEISRIIVKRRAQDDEDEMIALLLMS